MNTLQTHGGTSSCRGKQQGCGGGTAKEIVSPLMCVDMLCVYVRLRTRVTSVPAVLGGAGLACPSDLQIPFLLRSTQSRRFFRTHMCCTSQRTHTLRHPDGHTTYPTHTNCSLNQNHPAAHEVRARPSGAASCLFVRHKRDLEAI